MKKTLLGLLLMLSGHSIAQGTLGHFVYNVRCATYEPQFPSGLAVNQVPGRRKWADQCAKVDADLTFMYERLNWQKPDGSIIPMYPVFGIIKWATAPNGVQFRDGGSNPKNLSFPIKYKDGSPCQAIDAGGKKVALPEDYRIVAMCRSSCFSKTVQVLTLEGFYTAENFHQSQSLAEVISITQDSKNGNITTEPRKVVAKISSLVEGEHTVFAITTESGKHLVLTAAHPLIKSDGHFIAAEDIKKGTGLLNEFGESEEMIQVEKKTYYGKVYNVALDARKGVVTDKVFVLEGLLSGDADIQNDHTAKAMRALNKWLQTPEEI